MSTMMGMPANQEDLNTKLNGMKEIIEEVNRQFQDPDKTTFVCVCISEFLSLYEVCRPNCSITWGDILLDVKTERMIQELTSFHIDTHNISISHFLKCNSLLTASRSRQPIAVPEKELQL
eukprot:Partr_v1_DN25693_c0_g1_i1_m4412 putative ATPase required for the post-translational delivery of tail-anchored (TA) proteins to the endoplasmic reticulum. Recognizes and selectively binds the transmembrane domain of TA proteins in the cytosol. This complex then targets to the endoplasmic reticulum by membrane-bound receptors, where the tail- anchored protein is released for insertion. This process is regulated by ATP binding and hydrolysis. ATP binding drives the homodimer towards the closed dime